MGRGVINAQMHFSTVQPFFSENRYYGNGYWWRVPMSGRGNPEVQ